MKIVGICPREGKTKTGKAYRGCVLHLMYEDVNVIGYATDSAFVSDEVLDGRKLTTGDDVRLLYNKHGYLTGLEILGHADA